MHRPKVHFAQVSLTVAKKVLADELRRKKPAEHAAYQEERVARGSVRQSRGVNEVKRG
jgi:hypothetical protein